MSIAQIGGASSPQIIYGVNATAAALSVGDVVQYDLVDGDGDGYDFVTPDLDTTKPESLHARRGVVWAAEGSVSGLSFPVGAAIAVQTEGYAATVSVDGTVGAGIAVGDPLIYQDGSSDLAVGTNNDWVVDALTATAIDAVDASDLPTAITLVNELSGDYTRLLADVTALRANIATLVDAKKVVAIAHEASVAASDSIAATIIKN